MQAVTALPALTKEKRIPRAKVLCRDHTPADPSGAHRDHTLRKRKGKKHDAGSESTPYINAGREDT